VRGRGPFNPTGDFRDAVAQVLHSFRGTVFKEGNATNASSQIKRKKKCLPEEGRDQKRRADRILRSMGPRIIFRSSRLRREEGQGGVGRKKRKGVLFGLSGTPAREVLRKGCPRRKNAYLANGKEGSKNAENSRFKVGRSFAASSPPDGGTLSEGSREGEGEVQKDQVTGFRKGNHSLGGGTRRGYQS